MADHEHKWHFTVHMDGCHFYKWAGKCECGAVIETYDERDIEDDPYSLVWMEEVEEGKPCERCNELIAGAKPIHRQLVTGPREAA